MSRSLKVFILAIMLATWLPVSGSLAQDAGVDLELVIAVDISGSVDPEEAKLQRQGYVQAFSDPAVIKAIQNGLHGAIAVTYMEWAGSHHQDFLVDWQRVHDEKTALAFADALAWIPTRTNVWTSISGAMIAGAAAFERNPFRGPRRVIDISGDGANNEGPQVALTRDEVLQRRLTVNGLPIVNDRPSRFGRRQIKDLDLYYTDCVIGGPGAFIIVANGFDDYARAVRRKLILEIAGIMPETAPGNLFQPAQLAKSSNCLVGELRRQMDDDY